MNNLPDWSRANEVYSRAYRVLENMARAGHVSQIKPYFKNRKQKIYHVSDEMRNFIEALNEGDEEKIKWHILENIKHLGR
ncbi:MAG: hypothetical protein ACTSW7_00630 [Candidatus Thorarchaeota archaeon]|nr:MAG: hypothetical protein DRQ25_16425 [Candidatus Fermentibacteria bacterium]HEC72592.1 hypothetical protein [Thermoplasmatales archaeon]